MEHLRELFHSALNDEGVVEIAGFIFQRDQVLRALEEVGYEQAFQDWLLERENELLFRAEEILALHDNANRFGLLKQAFQRKRMLPFIGAGMSFSSGFPLWTEYLRNLRMESHVPEADLERSLNAGDYEGAAELLYNDLGAALFDSSLEETFRVTRNLSGPVNYLFRLFPEASFITTNFDPLIESLAAEHLPRGFDKVQSGAQLEEALRLVSNGTRLLLKIHGECDVVTGRVLTKTEYDRAYSDDGVVKNFISRILFGQSMLFLGCSLQEDRTIHCMKKFVKENDPKQLPRHYAFLELKDSDDRVERKKHLAEANIFPIWYPEGEHDESIEALFIKLLEEES